MAARTPVARRIVGRDTELTELGGRLADVEQGASDLVLVEGEAGIGKTALLRELVSVAAGAGFQVVRGAAWDDRDAPPYWPWTQVARELKGLTRGTDLARLVLDDPSDVEHIERFELFDATAHLLMRAAEERPLLVVLDDVHAADPASLALARFVVRHVGDRRVLMVASYRPSEIDRSPESRAHIDALGADASHVLGLGPLDVAAVAALLAELDIGIDPELVHAVTGGHPLFVQQVARSGNTIPARRRNADESADDALRAAIDNRLARLSDTQRLVVAALGVIGHETAATDLAGLLAPVVPIGRGQLADELDALVELGILQYAGVTADRVGPADLEPGGAGWGGVGSGDVGSGDVEPARLVPDEVTSGEVAPVRRAAGEQTSGEIASGEVELDDETMVEVVHALVARAAIDLLDEATSELLHGRAASIVGDDPDRSGERAHHLLRAGRARREEAVKACLFAAEHATSVSAHEQAVTHYQQALDVLDLADLGEPEGGPLGPDWRRDRRRLDVLLELGRAQRIAGRSADAEVSFDRATQLAVRLDDPAASAAAALRGGIQLFLRTELDAARTDRIRSALEALPPGDDPLRARLLAELAAVDGFGPGPVARAAEAVAMARRVGDPLALGAALVAEQVVDLGPGTLVRRLATSREILVLARQVGDPNLATHGRTLLFGAALEHGDLRGVEVSRSPDGSGVLLERSHARLVQWVACTQALLDGRTSDAERVADESLAAGFEAGDSFALRIYGAQLGVIRRLQGRLGELEPIYERLWRANPDEAMWPAVLATIWAQDGRHAEARAALDSIASVESFPDGLHWMVTAALAADALAVVGHDALGPELWQRLLPFADRMVPVNLGAAVYGPVGLSLGLLGFRLGHVDEGIDHLERAVRVCARVRARPWLVQSQIELARALLDHRLESGGADRDDVGGGGGGGGSSGVADSVADRVAELLREAEVTAERCGLDRWVTEAKDLRDRLDAAMRSNRSDVRSSAVDVSTADDGSRPTISVLGAFEVVSADGQVATWSSRKARELLKILVARRGAPVHREVLMDLLWPGDDPGSVGNRLSVALWTVRRALDPDRVADSNEYVAADRQTVRLRVDMVDVDAERFLDAAQELLSVRAAGGSDADDGASDDLFGRLVEAARLHPGPALPDEPYAEWASGLQREVHIAHTRVLGAIAEMAVERGDDLIAADAFRGLVEADPYDRRTHEGLVAALERIGATSMAEVERRRYDAVITGT